MRQSRTQLCAVAALAIGLLAARAWCADTDETLQARVKAAFVLNFIRFTEWPKESFVKKEDALMVGAIGTPAMIEELENAMRGKRVNDRPIVIVPLSHAVEGAGRIHVLVVSGAAQPTGDILRAAGGGAVLTVGDAGDFTESGGVIRFYLEENKQRFEINTGASARARLQLSAKLLKLGRTIER